MKPKVVQFSIKYQVRLIDIKKDRRIDVSLKNVSENRSKINTHKNET